MMPMMQANYRSVVNLSGGLHRFTFDKALVVENVQMRVKEMKAEQSKIDASVNEVLAKHNLAPEKALPKLDKMTPYGHHRLAPEFKNLVRQRSLSRSIASIVEDCETFLFAVTHPKCLGTVGLGGHAVQKALDSVTKGHPHEETIDLSADEAKALFSPFDVKVLAAELRQLEPEIGVPALGTSPYAAMGAMQAVSIADGLR